MLNRTNQTERTRWRGKKIKIKKDVVAQLLGSGLGFKSGINSKNTVKNAKFRGSEGKPPPEAEQLLCEKNIRDWEKVKKNQ